MSVYDKYLLKKDKLLRRRIEINNTLYEQLVELTKIYDTSINKLVNIAIIEMIKTGSIQLYENSDDESKEAHNFAIRESSYKQLEKLKRKYGLSICKLTNIAIYNALKS